MINLMEINHHLFNHLKHSMNGKPFKLKKISKTQTLEILSSSALTLIPYLLKLSVSIVNWKKVMEMYS